MAGSRLFNFVLAISLVMSNIMLMAGDLFVWIEVSGGKTNICEGQKLILVGNATDGSGEYVKHSWAGNMELAEFINDQVLTIDTKTPGQYSFEYSVWDNLENSASTKISINVKPLPNSRIESKRVFISKLIGKKYPVKIYLKHKKDIKSIDWYKNGEVIDSDDIFSIKVKSDGIYRAVVTSNNGCVSYSNAIVVQ
ncbi:MAG: hypothetical protein KGZ97_12925 [Bacteroidetes bacterium]|nr:hypothetical protein [Bacteroidota bacterium]